MIEITAVFPLYVVENIEALKTFYIESFGFQAVFYDKNFYLHLLHPGTGAEIGFLRPELSNQPTFLHAKAVADGLVITLEVSDAKVALESARQMSLEFVMKYTEEVWGQNHFMVRDPAGLVIDIVEHTEALSS